jgi:hypothetical protein
MQNNLITNLVIIFISHRLRTSRSILFPIDKEPRDQFCFHLVANYAINFVIHSHSQAETQERSHGGQHIRNTLVMDVKDNSAVMVFILSKFSW